MGKIEWKWNDPSHFEAHRKEFSRPVEEILEEVEPLIGKDGRMAGEWMHRDFLLKKETGKTGLKLIGPENSSFWAFREGRDIPSHLILGEKESTYRICIWGWWEDRNTFIIHTIYPGQVAPREIHDRDLKLDEIPEALAFWSRHAIIIEEGACTFEKEHR